MSISLVMNFIRLLSCFDRQKIQLSYEDVYAILEVSYVKSYYTKVIDNGVFYHMVDLRNFWMYGYLSMTKRRDSAAVMISSESVDA